MDKKKIKYWSEHPIIAEVVAGTILLVIGLVIGGTNNPVIEHYFAADTASTFMDAYLVESGYVDASILDMESLDEQFQMIHNSFAQCEEAIEDAMIEMGGNQEEVSKMERAVLLSKLPDYAKHLTDECADKDAKIEQLNENITALTDEKTELRNEVDEYKQRKEAELKQSHLIIDGELMNNGDSVNNAVVRVDGNNYYSEALLNTFLYPNVMSDKIRYDLQEDSVVVGNAKPEKVKFSWNDMVSGREGIDVYEMGGGSSFAMAKNSYSEGLVLSESDCCYVQLRGKYSKMTFTYGHVDDTERSDLELKIYALDENGETYTGLLKTILLKGEMNPKDIEVPLGYASAIKIVVSGGSWYPRFGLTNIYFYS